MWCWQEEKPPPTFSPALAFPHRPGNCWGAVGEGGRAVCGSMAGPGASSGDRVSQQPGSSKAPKAQRGEDGPARTPSSLATGLDSNQDIHDQGQESLGLKPLLACCVCGGGGGVLLRDWGHSVGLEQVGLGWRQPSAQQLGCPASCLILLSRGDPAFCQSGGRQQGEGRGGGVFLPPEGTGTLPDQPDPPRHLCPPPPQTGTAHQ